MLIVAKKCVKCHAKVDSPLLLTKDLSLVRSPGGGAYFNQTYESLLASGNQPGHGKYVHPGRARTSLLIWRIFGRDSSRPWDDVHSTGQVSRMPPAPAEALTEDERRTFVEWVDMGALWDGIPGPDNLPGHRQNSGGRDK
jgi:hypothetical protein